MSAGDVVYGWSSRRYILATAAIACAAISLGWLTASLVLQTVIAPAFAVAYVIIFPAMSWMITRAQPPELSFGAEGIELAAERRDVLLVPYEIVAGARVRWFWPLGRLDVLVAVADESRIVRRDREGRRPLLKRKGDHVRVSMPLAGLRTSAADLRAELHRRGLAG